MCITHAMYVFQQPYDSNDQCTIPTEFGVNTSCGFKIIRNYMINAIIHRFFFNAQVHVFLLFFFTQVYQVAHWRVIPVSNNTSVYDYVCLLLRSKTLQQIRFSCFLIDMTKI